MVGCLTVQGLSHATNDSILHERRRLSEVIKPELLAVMPSATVMMFAGTSGLAAPAPCAPAVLAGDPASLWRPLAGHSSLKA